MAFPTIDKFEPKELFQRFFPSVEPGAISAAFEEFGLNRLEGLG
jgi:hypothetical protein